MVSPLPINFHRSAQRFSIAGPNLMVAGGFCDGDKVTMEPLEDICIMLENCTDGRVEQLRMLYALARRYQELRGVSC